MAAAGGTHTPLTFNYDVEIAPLKKNGTTVLDDPYLIEGEQIDLESISNREVSRTDIISMKQRSYTNVVQSSSQ